MLFEFEAHALRRKEMHLITHAQGIDILRRDVKDCETTIVKRLDEQEDRRVRKAIVILFEFALIDGADRAVLHVAYWHHGSLQMLNA